MSGLRGRLFELVNGLYPEYIFKMSRHKIKNAYHTFITRMINVCLTPGLTEFCYMYITNKLKMPLPIFTLYIRE